MTCKNCIKRETKVFGEAILITALALGIIVGIVGMIVVAVHSRDSYKYNWDEARYHYIVHAMNWTLFYIFGGITLPGIVTAVYCAIPDYKEKEVCK